MSDKMHDCKCGVAEGNHKVMSGFGPIEPIYLCDYCWDVLMLNQLVQIIPLVEDYFYMLGNPMSENIQGQFQMKSNTAVKGYLKRLIEYIDFLFEKHHGDKIDV